MTTLYSQILLALQVEPAYSFNRLLPQLQTTLTDLARQGRLGQLSLLLAEKHRFTWKFVSASLLTLDLLGQPDLAQLLRFAPYQALHQRIAVRYQLRPYDLQETIAYIKHHLRIAGSQDQIFSDGFLTGVYDYTKGVSRQINNICRSALLLGATENKKILDETDLKRVIHDQDGQLS